MSSWIKHTTKETPRHLSKDTEVIIILSNGVCASGKVGIFNWGEMREASIVEYSIKKER